MSKTKDSHVCSRCSRPRSLYEELPEVLFWVVLAGVTCLCFYLLFTVWSDLKAIEAVVHH